jgi:hypothetical protein
MPADMPVTMERVSAPMDEELQALDEKELRKLISKQAALVKPLLLLSKEVGVDLGPAKRLIAKGVADSKKGELVQAVKYMDQGLEVVDSRFRAKLTEDLNALADAIRDLKVSGMDVTKAVEMMSSAKERVDSNDFDGAILRMNMLLELIEKVRS